MDPFLSNPPFPSFQVFGPGTETINGDADWPELCLRVHGAVRWGREPPRAGSEGCVPSEVSGDCAVVCERRECRSLAWLLVVFSVIL